MAEVTQLPAFTALKERLTQDEVFKRYRQLGTRVNNNEKLLSMYDRYIKMQKELVNFEHYGVTKAKEAKEQELKELEEQLYDIPLFNEYIQTQIELEELFSMMTHVIESKVNDALKK